MPLFQISPKEIYVVFFLHEYEIPYDIIKSIIDWTYLIEVSMKNDLLFAAEVCGEAEQYEGITSIGTQFITSLNEERIH